MRNYLIYDEDGRIIQTGVVPAAMLELQGEPESGRFVMEGSADVCTQYVRKGVIVSRPVCPALLSTASIQADGIDEVVAWQVPAGARIAVQGPLAMSGTADGSNIAMTFATPGVYRFSVQLFPFQDMEVSINAV